jgi:hypothetical protein
VLLYVRCCHGKAHQTNPDAYSIDLASTLIIGVDLFKQPVAQLSEAKNLLQDFAHIPRAQRLLGVIASIELRFCKFPRLLRKHFVLLYVRCCHGKAHQDC